MVNLVNIKDYDIRGKLYYVQPNNLVKYDINIEDLEKIGVYNDDVFIEKEVAIKLVEINNLLRKEWLKLVVKDWYRSSELYELAYKGLCKMHWILDTNKILTMERKIHATWRAIDVSIAFVGWDDIVMKFGSHGDKVKYWIEQYDINFFIDSQDPEEQEMHNNRMKLYNLMNNCWFVLWSKCEYWHYELPMN